MGGSSNGPGSLFDGPHLSPRAEVSRAMALLPVCDNLGRAACLQRLVSYVASDDKTCSPSDTKNVATDEVLCRSGVPTAAAYLSRAALCLREGRQLLDALSVRASSSQVLCEEMRKMFTRERSLQIELACEECMSPARHLMQNLTEKGRPSKRGNMPSLEKQLPVHPDLLIRKLLSTEEGGTTLRYTAAEVDALFFQANELDSEVLHDVWKWPRTKSGSKVHLTDEDYYISADRPSIVTRIADATALDPTTAERISSQPSGLHAVRVLADSAPLLDKNADLFDTEVARCMANVFARSRNIESTAALAADEGLVSRLSRWSYYTRGDARGHLQVEAFRALSNLSQALQPDAKSRHFYVNGVLPLQAPVVSALSDQKHDTDVVFIHGLRGGPLMTWRCGNNNVEDVNSHRRDYEKIHPYPISHPNLEQAASRGNLEPPRTITEVSFRETQVDYNNDTAEVWARDWLPADAPNCRVISVGHDAGVLRGGLGRGMIGPSLAERAADICAALHMAGVGRNGRRVIFVTHSYGGLLVKEALIQNRDLCTSTRGIVFFGVPHFGSPAAASLPGHTRVVLSKAVRELFPASEPDSALLKLNESFCRAVKAHDNASTEQTDFQDIEVFSFGEELPLEMGGVRGRPQIRLDLVPSSSADPGVGTFSIIPGSDHITVSKPGKRSDLSYQIVFALARNSTKS